MLSNALMDMYFNCGSADRALDVFRTMPCRPNLFCWNTVIAGLGMNGRGEDAVAAFRDIVEGARNRRQHDVKPDAVTFVALLSACSHSGLVAAGRKLFADMLPVYGVPPQTEHYGCVVDPVPRGPRRRGRGARADDAVPAQRQGARKPRPARGPRPETAGG